jgi:hypothetical protein
VSGLPDLGGKVAVVTGGASGIGKGIATQLVAEGARVIIADIQRDAMAATAAEIGAAMAVHVDVSDPASVDALARQVIETFGTVHVVCNNAGIGPLAPVADLTLDDWRWMIGVNLWGVIHGVHTFLPILKQNRDGGHIVNTASMAGLVAGPRLGAYAAAKYGVVTCTPSPTRTGTRWSPRATRRSRRPSVSRRRSGSRLPTRGWRDARVRLLRGLKKRSRRAGLTRQEPRSPLLVAGRAAGRTSRRPRGSRRRSWRRCARRGCPRS